MTQRQPCIVSILSKAVMTRTVPQWRDCLLVSSLRSPNHHMHEIKQQIKQRSARHPKRTAGRIRVNLAQLRLPDRRDVELPYSGRQGWPWHLLTFGGVRCLLCPPSIYVIMQTRVGRSPDVRLYCMMRKRDRVQNRVRALFASDTT
jgi:hypothetical protein